MSTQPHSHSNPALRAVSDLQSEANRKALQPILTDLIAYGRVLKQLHWNVVGPFFRPIHLHLDEIYESVEDSIDTVAERLVATGHSPNGRLKDVVAATEIDDAPEGFLKDSDVLRHAVERTREVIGLIRSRMAEIEEIDTVTADLLHQIVDGLEKHHWMLAAQRA